MRYHIDDLQRTFLNFVYHLDMHEWALFLIVVVGIGVMCMRGYGSWKSY